MYLDLERHGISLSYNLCLVSRVQLSYFVSHQHHQLQYGIPGITYIAYATYTILGAI